MVRAGLAKMIQPIKRFVRIGAARCNRCGGKPRMRIRRGERVNKYELPVTMDMAVVERTPWKCGTCGGKILLDVSEVE